MIEYILCGCQRLMCDFELKFMWNLAIFRMKSSHPMCIYLLVSIRLSGVWLTNTTKLPRKILSSNAGMYCRVYIQQSILIQWQRIWLKKKRRRSKKKHTHKDFEGRQTRVYCLFILCHWRHTRKQKKKKLIAIKCATLSHKPQRVLRSNVPYLSIVALSTTHTKAEICSMNGVRYISEPSTIWTFMAFGVWPKTAKIYLYPIKCMCVLGFYIGICRVKPDARAALPNMAKYSTKLFKWRAFVYVQTLATEKTFNEEMKYKHYLSPPPIPHQWRHSHDNSAAKCWWSGVGFLLFGATDFDWRRYTLPKALCKFRL